jgi:hypothetical protein
MRPKIRTSINSKSVPLDIGYTKCRIIMIELKTLTMTISPTVKAVSSFDQPEGILL